MVAGNRAAQAGVRQVLQGYPLVMTDNVVPRIGVLTPEPARRAVREMFLAHVIGGKGLSARADFTAMVQGPTPDLVLTGVEVLAAETGEDVAVHAATVAEILPGVHVAAFAAADPRPAKDGTNEGD